MFRVATNRGPFEEQWELGLPKQAPRGRDEHPPGRVVAGCCRVARLPGIAARRLRVRLGYARYGTTAAGCKGEGEGEGERK